MNKPIANKLETINYRRSFQRSNTKKQVRTQVCEKKKKVPELGKALPGKASTVSAVKVQIIAVHRTGPGLALIRQASPATRLCRANSVFPCSLSAQQAIAQLIPLLDFSLRALCIIP